MIWLLLLYIYGIEVPPSSMACALPRASKNKPLEWGLPLEAMVCKSGKQCTYNDQDWNPDLSKHTYATIDEDPNILA